MGVVVGLFGHVARTASCAQCGSEFETKTQAHRFCSERCKYRYHAAHNPAEKANNRERCARWAAEHRSVKNANPWLLGAPPFEEYLPGGGITLAFDPHVTFEHRQLSALHGLVTSMTGPHEANTPRFTLVPWHSGCGWGVLFREESDARALAKSTVAARLGARDVRVRCGDLWRLRAPQVSKRGHRKLRIDAITPVCVRCTNGSDNSQRLYTAPTAGNLLSTLSLMTTKRIGLLVDPDTLRLELVERATQAATLQLAGRDGRLGNMRGWVGSVIVDANAPAHWLLAVAARIGLGGTTSFGFGRIKLTEL